MTAPTNPHALRLLESRGLDSSPSNTAWAARRVLAVGRLAELGAHRVSGLLRVRTVETGDADAMAPGSMFAEVWLDARDIGEWRARAGQLLELERAAASQGLRLTLAVYRSSRFDRLRERLAWALRKRS